MQVNLQQHPNAFATLEDAFDPVMNANYAARFLVDLQRESGDWVTAAGLYHSRTEALAAPYRDSVVLRFGGMGGLPRPAALPVPASPVQQLAQAWGATLPKAPPAGGGLHLWAKPPRAAVRDVASVQLSAR